MILGGLLLSGLLGCTALDPAGHGHDHHHGGHGHAHDDAAGGDSIARTRWADGHEIFVELDAPVAGQAFRYHAHVTRVVDHSAVTTGALSLRFEDDGFAVESHTNDQLERAGVFAGAPPAPSTPGPYRLVLTYADGDTRSEWDGGVVTVGEAEPVPHAREAGGEIRFGKEAQWQVPFAVAPAAEVALAPTVEASAVVSAAPGQSTVVAAPVDGLLAWTDGLPVVGRQVVRGERVAALVLADAAESWSRLQADLATSRVDLDLAQKERSRVEELAARDLVSARRLQQVQAQVERASAELSVNERRVSALTSEGSGAMPIRAPADGIVVSVGGAHGARIQAGASVLTVVSGPGILLEGRVHDRRQTALSHVSSIAVRRGDWDAARPLVDARVLTERLVFDPQRLSAPLHVLADDPVGLSIGDRVQLKIGVGQPTPRLAIPQSAVVEINGQDVVFVQTGGESFTRRRVTLGVSDPGHVEVLTGLSPGDRVVVQGGFDVHVASLAGALESHRH